MEIVGGLLIFCCVALIAYFILTPDKGSGFVGAGCSLFAILFSLLIGVILIVGGCIVLSNAIKKKRNDEEEVNDEVILEDDSTPMLPTDTSVASQIREFKQLADDGIISPEDYEAKKKQLLGLK